MKEIKYHGILNFFKGSSIIALSCLPSHALFFTNYEIMKAHFQKEDTISIFGGMFLGGFSNIFHDLVMTPAEMIKQRAQLLKTKSNLSIIRNVL